MKTRLAISTLVAFFMLAGCGGSSGPKLPHVAKQLHQPAPPVVKVPVRPAKPPKGSDKEAKGDGVVRAGGTGCGRERWAVKTATDQAAGQIPLKPVDTTIAAIDALQSTNTGNPDQPRQAGYESALWRVSGTLVSAKAEPDGDYHLDLSDGGSGHLGVEIPHAPACTEPPITSGVSVFESQIEQARATFEQDFGVPGSSGYTPIGHAVTVTGVGFFDFGHGQHDAAPNYAELHPVTAIVDP